MGYGLKLKAGALALCGGCAVVLASAFEPHDVVRFGRS